MNIVLRELDCAAPVVDHSALEQFQRQWATYQKLVECLKNDRYVQITMR